MPHEAACACVCLCVVCMPFTKLKIACINIWQRPKATGQTTAFKLCHGSSQTKPMNKRKSDNRLKNKFILYACPQTKRTKTTTATAQWDERTLCVSEPGMWVNKPNDEGMFWRGFDFVFGPFSLCCTISFHFSLLLSLWFIFVWHTAKSHTYRRGCSLLIRICVAYGILLYSKL